MSIKRQVAQQSGLEQHLRTDWKTVHNLWKHIQDAVVTAGGVLDLTPYTKIDGTRAFTGVVAGIAPTIAAHLATKAYVDIGRATVEGKTDDYAVLAADLGKILIMTAATAKTFTLPAVTAADVGLSIMLMKRGAGKLTIQAGGTDTIQDSTAAGTLYNDLAEETFALVMLRVIAAGAWMIEQFTGSGWRTS